MVQRRRLADALHHPSPRPARWLPAAAVGSPAPLLWRRPGRTQSAKGPVSHRPELQPPPPQTLRGQAARWWAWAPARRMAAPAAASKGTAVLEAPPQLKQVPGSRWTQAAGQTPEAHTSVLRPWGRKGLGPPGRCKRAYRWFSLPALPSVLAFLLTCFTLRPDHPLRLAETSVAIPSSSILGRGSGIGDWALREAMGFG